MGERVEQVTSGRGRKYVVHHGDGTTTDLVSVTTILGSLPKNGLDWYGAKLGLRGAQQIAARYGDEFVDMDFDDLYAAFKQTEHAPHRALRKAANRGTAVHEVAEILVRDGKLTDVDEKVADSGYVRALVAWYTAHDVASWNVIGVEERLYSTEHAFAGTCDLLAQRPDGVYVSLDFKTSAGIHPSHLLQARAYAHAAIERGLVPDGAEVEAQVVRLGLDGDFEVQRSRYEIEDFAAVVAMHRMLNDKSKTGVPVTIEGSKGE